MPKVSVVIPSYNHGRFIEKAVRSVLDQTYRDLELIVIDDGSQDNSLARLAAITDNRLRVIAQENQGAHAAINRGLAEAQGHYLTILNSDDVYAPRRLERMLPILDGNAAIGLLSSYIEVIDGQGKAVGVKRGYANLEPWPLPLVAESFRSGVDNRAALLTENYLATTSNFLFRRSWYEAIGAFLPLRYTHDWDFALRMASVADIEIIPEPLLQYRIHGNNTIHENRAAMVFEICWCLAVHLPKHRADSRWYDKERPERRVSQLLHSIYTYGNERVLTVMLLEKLAENPVDALELLGMESARRQLYLEQIRRNMSEKTVADLPRTDSSAPARLLSHLRRLASALLNRA
ncbi:MAG: glycosyltransferase [Caldilineaceae bacterium]|nr:glycosyltransferase [Caldilineaceae bacterium]